MENLHEHAKLIKALGGVRQVCKDYNLNINTVQAWLKRGISSKYQLDNPAFMRKAKKLASKV